MERLKEILPIIVLEQLVQQRCLMLEYLIQVLQHQTALDNRFCYPEHKALEALHTYERVTPSQEKAVSEILSGSNFSGDVKDNSKSSKTSNKDASDAKENDLKPDEDASIFPLSNDATNFLDNLPSEVYNYWLTISAVF